MEELFLCGFFSYYKLYIINQKHINIAVTVPERGDQGDIVRIPERVDQLIGKCLR